MRLFILTIKRDRQPNKMATEQNGDMSIINNILSRLTALETINGTLLTEKNELSTTVTSLRTENKELSSTVTSLQAINSNLSNQVSVLKNSNQNLKVLVTKMKDKFNEKLNERATYIENLLKEEYDERLRNLDMYEKQLRDQITEEPVPIIQKISSNDIKTFCVIFNFDNKKYQAFDCKYGRIKQELNDIGDYRVVFRRESAFKKSVLAQFKCNNKHRIEVDSVLNKSFCLSEGFTEKEMVDEFIRLCRK